jgi:hypothetical protein
LLPFMGILYFNLPQGHAARIMRHPHGLQGPEVVTLREEYVVGVQENTMDPGLIVSPNPSAGRFQLNQPAEAISVFNAMGQLLFRSQGSTINLVAWPEGVYTAVIQTAKGKFTQRLVVLR